MKRNFLGFRASDNEVKKIRETAKKLNFATVSAFIRKVVLDFIDRHATKK